MKKYIFLFLSFLFASNFTLAQIGKWRILHPDLTDCDFLDAIFTDNQTGYFLTDEEIIKTTDGGDNWFKLTTHLNFSYTNFYFKNEMGLLKIIKGN